MGEMTVLRQYSDFLGKLDSKVFVKGEPGSPNNPFGIKLAVDTMRVTRTERVKAMLFGNGGSLAIADHIANDFNLCAGWRSMALSNPSNMAAIGNDFDFESVFEKQIEWLGRRGDIAIAMSCSGMSENVLRGARKATAMGMALITLSAGDPGNELAKLGRLNFLVDTAHMGLAQVAHLVLLHAVCDIGAKEKP